MYPLLAPLIVKSTVAILINIYLVTGDLILLFNYRSYVRLISSDRPGMGKSFYVQQLAQQITKTLGRTSASCTIPIHGPEVTADTVMDFLIHHLVQDPLCSMYHLDIASNVSNYQV